MIEDVRHSEVRTCVLDVIFLPSEFGILSRATYFDFLLPLALPLILLRANMFLHIPSSVGAAFVT